MIPAGYVAVVLGFVIGEARPRGSDELDMANVMLAWLLGALVGAGLFLAGLVQGLRALARSRRRLRWFDYALLAAGAAPLVF